MLGFVVALKKEAQSVIDSLKNVKREIIAQKEIYSGKIFNKDCTLIVSGIGKVNASLSTQLLIDKFNPELILNFGTAGGVDDSVKALQYYIVSECCQFDFDLRDLDGVPLGFIQDYNLSFFPATTLKFDFNLEKRKLASADRFTESQIDTKEIKNLGCSLRDMEGGAIAQVCYSNSVPLIAVKGVTDVVGNGLTAEQFTNNLVTVSTGFNNVIQGIISKL